jgi:hypothetical protein
LFMTGCPEGDEFRQPCVASVCDRGHDRQFSSCAQAMLT